MAASSSSATRFDEEAISRAVASKLESMQIPMTLGEVQLRLKHYQQSILKGFMKEDNSLEITDFAVEWLTMVIVDGKAVSGDLSGDPHCAHSSNGMTLEEYYASEFRDLVEEVRQKCLLSEMEEIDRELTGRMALLQGVWETKKPDLGRAQEVHPKFRTWIADAREAINTILALDSSEERWESLEGLKRDREKLEIEIEDEKTARKLRQEEEEEHKKRMEEEPSMKPESSQKRPDGDARGKKLRKRKKTEAETNSLLPAGPSSSSIALPLTVNHDTEEQHERWPHSPKRLERKSLRVTEKEFQSAEKVQAVALTRLQQIKKQELMEELFGKTDSDEELDDAPQGSHHLEEHEEPDML